VSTYIELWPLFSLALSAIGMYLMGVSHGAKGLWDRTSTARVVRRLWRQLRGKSVVVVPIGSGRRGPLSKRSFVYFD
jgi:hypothetical protein